MITATFGIVGGGLAGSLLASHLPPDNTVLVDDGRTNAGSRAPAVLFHPFPGRSLRETPELVMALAEAFPLYNTWEAEFPAYVHRRMMLRPLGGENGERILRGLKGQKHATIAGVRVHWLPKSAVKQKYPQTRLEEDCISYDSCFSIELASILAEIAAKQRVGGVRCKDTIMQISHDGGSWHLLGENHHIKVQTLIMANGASLLDWFPRLRGECERGHLLSIHNHGLPFMVSRGGFHCGPVQKGVVLGATRWKKEEDAPSIAEAQEFLLDLYNACVTDTAKKGTIWEGERLVTFGQRYPYAGPIPGKPNVYALGGLGSKGMLYGPFAAKHVAEQVLYGISVHPSFAPRLAE